MTWQGMAESRRIVFCRVSGEAADGDCNALKERTLEGEKTMQLLKEKVMKEGIVLSDQVLKVDSFLNHQMDPVLMKEVGKEFKRLFAGQKIDRVLTIESSGIAPGIMTALELEVPLIFARKQKSLTLREDIYVEKVYSFTKQETNEITVSRKFMQPGERVLIIDDFLANGEAAFGLARIVEQAGAEVARHRHRHRKSVPTGRPFAERSGLPCGVARPHRRPRQRHRYVCIESNPKLREE